METAPPCPRLFYLGVFMMKIIADGKTIRENVPSTHQALLLAAYDGRCLDAASLEIVAEGQAPVKPGKKNKDEAEKQ
jgi:hypothetical protein